MKVLDHQWLQVHALPNLVEQVNKVLPLESEDLRGFSGRQTSAIDLQLFIDAELCTCWYGLRSGRVSADCTDS